MNALQPLESRPSPQSLRPTRRHSPRRRSQYQRAVTTEITLKLTINVILSLTAIAALLRLLPYQLTQQEKLREIHSEVKETELRVNQLRDNFSRNFDPNQTRKVMQEQSPKVDPNQRRIFWIQ